MKFTLGTTDIKSMFNGTTKINKIFIGTNLVYQSIPYLYNAGTQVVPFTTGYSVGANGSVTFGTTNVEIIAGSLDAIVNERSIRTTNLINLAEVKKVYIDWSVDISGIQQIASLVVSTVATATYTTNNALLSFTSSFSRRIDSLDVTALGSSYYIKVHARDNRTLSGVNATTINVYAIYLEY